MGLLNLKEKGVFMITVEQIETINKYWNELVVFAFKKGLWEIERDVSTPDQVTVRRFRGYKSNEVLDSVMVKAKDATELASKLSKIHYSGKSKKITLG